MELHDLVQSSWQSLLRTRGRSILTMLGIVIGIAAVILALSIGESATLFILSQISSFGSDKLIIHPGTKALTQLQSSSAFVDDTLTYTDYKRLRREPYVDAITAEVVQSDMVKAGSVNKSISVMGIMPDDLTIMGLSMSDGQFFSDADVEGRTRVAVLGISLADEMFGQGNAVGRSFKLGTLSYKVVGVLKQAGFC